jgi:hypothetical protein
VDVWIEDGKCENVTNEGHEKENERGRGEFDHGMTFPG